MPPSPDGSGAKSWYGPGTGKADKWLEDRSVDLLEGRWEKVMRSIRAWKPLEAEDIKTKQDNLGYFKRNRERMRYEEYRAKEMHIGSGIAESSCPDVRGAGQTQTIGDALDRGRGGIHAPTAPPLAGRPRY